jgi:predicted permease
VSIEGLLPDVRYALRVLRKDRGFTFVAVTSLALAIGANTTIFSVAKTLLYDRLAVPHAAELRLLTWRGTDFPYPMYERLRAQNQVLGDLLACHVTGANATVGSDAQRVIIHEVSGNYYAVLGVRPQLGRPLSPSDDTGASPPVAVISDEFWEREFARSPAVLGRSMRLNDVPLTIVGVNPRNYTGTESTLPAQTPSVIVTLSKATLVTPSSDRRNWLADPAGGAVNIFGRARPGISDRAAEAALEAQVSAFVRDTLPASAADEIPRLVLRDGSRGLFRQQQTFATPISALMIFLGVVLLLACANIATLMLARGARRHREMSVRVALGASRGQLARQVLVESLLLAGAGGAIGLSIALVVPPPVPARFDANVFVFTALITMFTGVVFGVGPALAESRADLNEGMKRARGAGKILVGFQIALSTLLVIAAGLFIRSLAGLNAVNPGFRTDHLLLAQVVLPQNRYGAGANVAFHQRLERAIADLPGVTSVGPAEVAYLSGDILTTNVWRQGEAIDPNRPQPEAYNAVGVDFFAALGIPIVAGRAFAMSDTNHSLAVGIINQSLAKKRFPNQDPIGQNVLVYERAGYGDILTNGPIEIVGVCADTLYADLHGVAPPQLFLPYAQQPQIRRLTYQIRTQTSPDAIVPALRRVVHAADPQLPVVNIRTQQEQIEADLHDERLFVTLTSGFGMLALVLAAVGIYGVMAYSVARRTREIGIRLALGAVPRQLLAMVLREASWLSAMAVAIGVGTALLLSRLLKSMLFGIAPDDPATLGGAALLLMMVALAASWIPARRAASVEPMEALRPE